MYRDVKFKMEKPEQIEMDIREAGTLYPDTRRVFLVNGDAFVLSANRLRPIAKLINEHLPFVEVITMYASINNIMGKSDDELVELRKLGINELWIGAETGHDESLKYHNKGFDLQDSRKQMQRLNKAGMDFYFGFMFGAAGSGKGIENAHATAALINTVKPLGIVPTTLGGFGNSPLAKDIEKGIFAPATEMEVLQEQKKLIELIEVETLYMGIHGINTLSFDAVLPGDREQIMAKLENAIEELDENYLQSVAERHSI